MSGSGPMEARRQEVTVVRARELKLELERAIHALILDFQANTGVPVESIDLTHVSAVGGDRAVGSVYVATAL